MLKHLSSLVAFGLAFCLAVPAFAAFDDVTFTEDTDFVLSEFYDGDTAEDAGDTYIITIVEDSVVEALDVETYGFTAALQNSSSITFISEDRLEFTITSEAEVTTTTCTDTESSLTLAVTSEGETEIDVYLTGETCVADAGEEDEDADDDGSSSKKGKSSARKEPPQSLTTTQSDDEATITALQMQLIEILKQIIAILMAQR